MNTMIAAIEFALPPKKLHIKVEDGEFESHCGFISDDKAQMVLVAVVRDTHMPGGLYRPPLVSYIHNVIAGSDEVRSASGINWRLPRDDHEHHELLEILVG